MDAQGRIPSWVLLAPGADDAELAAASPISLADAAFPPTVLFHATNDSVIATSFLERTVTNRPELDEEADQFSFLRLLQAQAG